MKGTVGGFILGVFVCLTASYFIVKQEFKSKYEQGLYHGKIHGLHIASDSLKPYFSRPPKDKSYKVLFSVKTTSVVIYENDNKIKLGVFE